MTLEDYIFPDLTQILENIGITLNTRAIPEIAEYRRVQAVVSRGWLWGLFHWRAYRKARASLPALMQASQRAFLDAVLDFGEQCINETTV